MHEDHDHKKQDLGGLEEQDLGQRSAEHRCLQSLIEVFLFIDGQLDSERAGEIEEHLKHCQKCYGRVEFEKLVKGYIKRRSPVEQPPATVLDSVTRIFEKQN